MLHLESCCCFAGVVEIITNDGRIIKVAQLELGASWTGILSLHGCVVQHLACWNLHHLHQQYCACMLLQGLFRGYDQVTNVILENCCELVFSTTVSAADTPLCSGQHAWRQLQQWSGLRPIPGRLPESNSGYTWREGQALTLCMCAVLQAGVQLADLGLQVIRGDNM